MAGIMLMFTPSQGGYLDLAGLFRLLGIPIAIGGIIIDVAKAPFTLFGSIFCLVKGAIYGIASIFEQNNNAEKRQIAEIMDSYKIRFANTLKLLIAMDLETNESVLQKINKKDHGLQVLISLTTLNTAYASRFLTVDSILLANGKILQRVNCPAEGRDIFNYIINIKNKLRELDFHMMTNAEATPLIKEFIPQIKNILDNPIRKSELKSMEINPYVREIILVLYDIGSSGIKKKSLTRKMSDIKSRLVGDIKDVIENRDAKLIFVDHSTGLDLVKPVIGNDGYLYSEGLALHLMRQRELRSYIKYKASLDPKHADFYIDPITGDEIKKMVVANDGKIYDMETAKQMKIRKVRGIIGIKIDNYTICNMPWKWKKIN